MHQRIGSRRGKGSVLGVVPLAYDQQVVAPVYRPHPVGIQIRQLGAGRLYAPAGINKLNWSVTGENEDRCSRTKSQPCTSRHTRRSNTAGLSAPTELRLLLRLEDIAIQECRNAQVGNVDELRDVEIDGNTRQYVGLLAGQSLRLY